MILLIWSLEPNRIGGTPNSSPAVFFFVLKPSSSVFSRSSRSSNRTEDLLVGVIFLWFDSCSQRFSATLVIFPDRLLISAISALWWPSISALWSVHYDDRRSVHYDQCIMISALWWPSISALWSVHYDDRRLHLWSWFPSLCLSLVPHLDIHSLFPPLPGVFCKDFIAPTNQVGVKLIIVSHSSVSNKIG